MALFLDEWLWKWTHPSRSCFCATFTMKFSVGSPCSQEHFRSLMTLTLSWVLIFLFRSPFLLGSSCYRQEAASSAAAFSLASSSVSEAQHVFSADRWVDGWLKERNLNSFFLLGINSLHLLINVSFSVCILFHCDLPSSHSYFFSC